MITEKQYKTALKVVSDYKKQQRETIKPKECKHYNTDWSIEEQRYVCLDCDFKGPKKGE
jgi:hypothetical protein